MILKKYLSGHKNSDLDDFRHPYFNFCLMKKDFLIFIMCYFLECFWRFFHHSVSNGTGEGGNMEDTEKKLKKRLKFSSMSLVNFVHTFRALVSSFLCVKACFLSFFNLFQSHSFKICKVKIPQLLSFHLISVQ